MKELLQKIESVVGPTGLLTGDDVSSRQASWAQQEPCGAGAIVRPANTEEVSKVMRLCHEAGQAVVPCGGNTGLVRGTNATAHEIMLSTELMTAIEDVDPAGCTMTVQAGAILQNVHDKADAADLYFPLDFGARGSAAIGGTLSTNAGGNSVIRFGMAREQVLGLEAVLADGTIVSSMNNMLKNNAGYDLKQLFIGTEGTLGIITRAVLRLRPALRSQNTAFVAVDEFGKIPVLLRELGALLGGTLNAFEVLWSDYYQLILGASDEHTPPVAPDHPFYILIESRGGDQQADAARFEHALEAVFEKELVADASLATSSTQRDAMWAIRDDIENLMKALYPPIAFDISVPISDANTYVENVKAGLAKHFPDTGRTVTFGHLGDSNIHFVMTIGNYDPQQVGLAMNIVYENLKPFGGSISAEHGIGLEKKPFLPYSRSEVEIGLMQRLKDALDPKGILNPGKVLN
ncbi:MAG: FAD-binding oxidoreductase [Woeseiaceae bacterium]|nr:FAD-binding oxidoreductase [Woeseiaceae bacterium]